MTPLNTDRSVYLDAVTRNENAILVPARIGT